MVTLHEGDCYAMLADLPRDAVIVSDPPYGDSFCRNEGGGKVAGQWIPRRNRNGVHGYDKPFDPTPLLGWRCVLFGADHYANRLPDGGCFHAWDKRSYSTLDDSFSDVEFIWTSWKCKARIISHLWKGVQQETEKNTPKFHINQKPVAVMRQLLEWFTKPEDLIIDPFAGSGSTLVACLKTGRRGIGIEIDPQYAAVARRRIRDAETPMFDRVDSA
jgi:site-specific DNA-methyltransferase (adenine-specific)/modification methylase